MMRQASMNWIWVTPPVGELEAANSYAVMRWKNGALYAGPAGAALDFPPQLVDEASVTFCSRAEALRHAVEGKVQA